MSEMQLVARTAAAEVLAASRRCRRARLRSSSCAETHSRSSLEQRQLGHGVAGEGRREPPVRLVRRRRGRQVDHAVEPEPPAALAHRLRRARGGWGRSCRRRDRSSSAVLRVRRSIARRASSCSSASSSLARRRRSPTTELEAAQPAVGGGAAQLLAALGIGGVELAADQERAAARIRSGLNAPSSRSTVATSSSTRCALRRDRSTRCTSTRQRSTWRRNWMPSPAPLAAPAISPGRSAMTNGSRERARGHHPELRHQRGERVVGDLGTRRRDHADEASTCRRWAGRRCRRRRAA